MKRIVYLSVIASLLLGLAGLVTACGPTPTPAPTKAPEPTKPAPTPVPPTPTPLGPVTFLSTQLRPVEEAEKMRKVILAGFPAKVDFIPEDTGPFTDRILAEQKAGKVTVDLVGGLHGDLPPFIEAGALEDLTPLLAKLGDRKFPAAFLELGRMGTKDKLYYIPWMQATYLLAANKKALQYLPQGANQDALTYDQLKQWAANVQKATGEKKLGFPAGPKGLMHRFFQGYLYPSYTGGQVTGYRSPEAVKMWQEFKDLWQYVNPQSTTYDFMQEPLLAGEVWIAFDHTARLINALKQKPDDFVVMPAPAGPKGLGFMPVIVGLAITKGAPNRAGAEKLIEHLTRPETQVVTLREVGFFPVVEATIPKDLPVGIRMEGEGVAKQSAAKAALPSLLPVGLGGKGGEFNKVYLDTFARIVIKGEDIAKVLDEQAKAMQKILDETKAPCWPPDAPSVGPCKVK
ncbi:MAG: carbohydrate ABC transporter substrate-binding protein [Chloroflexi bacterium]|nr:carbohydrate ABC transporter substrate-binding protein [Chloroflexota bacterium]